MPGISVRVGGAWTPVKAIWARVNGVWTPVKAVSARTATGWKQTWSSLRAYISGNMSPVKSGGAGSTNYYDRGTFTVASIPAGATVTGHQWSVSDSGGMLGFSTSTSAMFIVTGPTYNMNESQQYYSFTVTCSAIVNGVRRDVEAHTDTYTTRGDI